MSAEGPPHGARSAPSRAAGGGLARIDERVIENAIKGRTARNGDRSGPAQPAYARPSYKLADNELADLIVRTPERDRWLFDPQRGLFRARKGWDWELDPLSAALGRRLTALVEERAEKAERPLKLRYSTLRGAKEMVKQAVTETPDWDSDPMLAGLPGGGVLDLRTGWARAAERGDFVSRRLGVVPEPSRRTTRFQRFLREMTGGDQEVSDWLRAWAGYVLTGHTVSHVAVFLHGDGAAGKSTFVEILTHILGGYAERLPPDALVAQRG